MKEVKFNEADLEDLDGIMEVEEKCFTAPWSKNMFLSEMYNENTLFFVMLENDIVVGYISLYKVLDEIHVNNIAIDPDYQRQGYASSIMDNAIFIAEKLSAASITLEVRSSNIPAIGLYKKYGFETLGVRKNYYKNPKEDAIIMTRKLI
jgi:ribosomal-protein-alanine N-acetyltransferase